MAYGLNVYCGGYKLLSTSEMGLAFNLFKDGTNIPYHVSPNRYSQVEFPLSPLVDGWGNSQEEVVNLFDNLPENSRFLTFGPSTQRCHFLLDNTFTQTTLTYRDGHIVNSSVPTLGLSNTVHGSKQPIPIITRSSRYGLFAKDSLINLACEVYGYNLWDNTEVYTSTRIRKARMHYNLPPDLAQPHIVFIPCDAEQEILVIYPEYFNRDVSVALYAQTRWAHIYLCYSDAEFVRLKVQRYRTQFGKPIYRDYGLRVCDSSGWLRFSTENPPLLPLFVAMSGELHAVPPSPYPLGVVFSRVDTIKVVPHPSTVGSGAFVITNGVRWSAPNKLESELMGFGSNMGEGRSGNGISFYLGAISKAWFERGRYRLYSSAFTTGEFGLGLHDMMRSVGITETQLFSSGAFLAAAVYHPT